MVVGGNGFIGHQITKRAVELGWNVICLSFSEQFSNKIISTSLQYVSIDITDNISLERVLRKVTVDYVVNCSGYVDHSSFFSGGRRVLDVHFLGVTNLVRLLDRSILKAFVNIGSSDEYGNAVAPQSESQREAPISSYSLGKVAATHFLQMLHRTENFPATTLRLFLPYGPGQDKNRFLPQVILGCLEGRSFPASKGIQLRDFCYIDDIVDAIFLTFSTPSARGEVINIASGIPISILQMVKAVRYLVGSGEPRFGEIPYRSGENMALYATISKAQAILKWQPKVPLEVGLDKVIKWMRERL